MADLIAIGYDDTNTAVQAMDEVERLAKDLVIQPDAVAAIIRSEDGKYRTVTNQHIVGAGRDLGHVLGTPVRDPLLRAGVRHCVRCRPRSRDGQDRQVQKELHGAPA